MFSFISKYTRLGNDNIKIRFVAAISRLGFNLADNFHALQDLSKDNMLTIQPSSLDSGDEEFCKIASKKRKKLID